VVCVCVYVCVCVFMPACLCEFVFVHVFWLKPVAQSVGGSDCGSEGMGFDPKHSEGIFHLNRQDCSGGSEL
jgi:hypothetical protein